MRFFSVAVALVLAPLASAIGGHHFQFQGMQVGPFDSDRNRNKDTDLLGINGTNGWGTFDQLLDHANPQKGTFDQRYWYGTQYWKGPGSPVILTSPGEQAADGFNVTYTTEQRLTGLMAKKMGAAVIVLEHRYWGGSSPFKVLTTENLQYLTLDNSLKDLTYFAKNFDPPFDKSGKTNPKKAPWVFAGGSYSGALAGWLEKLEPGTYWAYYGTSGVVETMADFWTYYSPAMEVAPKNCTKDLTAVIDYIDNIVFHGSPDDKKKLKDKFKLGDLQDGDFGAALLNGPAQWQATQFYTLARNGVVPFFQFCDYIENSWPNATAVANASGVGVKKALDGYAKWMNDIYLPDLCEGYGLDGFNGTYNTNCLKWQDKNSVLYKDLRVDNTVNRQWMWMLCNEPFEWWQTGAPFGTPSFVSRKVDVDYFRKQCQYMFQDNYGLREGKTTAQVNKWTGGWFHTDTKRLMYTNGQYDPWLDVTVSSKISRPGGPVQNSTQLPVRVVPGGVHCSDLYGPNWDANAEVKAIAEEESDQMARWVKEFYDHKQKREIEWAG